MNTIKIDVIGYTYRPCGPFPCDADRSCGLTECSNSGKLDSAFTALKHALLEKYSNNLCVSLVSLDSGVPEWVQEIVRKEHPPLPIILVNGKVAPIGAISVPKICEYIDSLQ